MLASSAGHSGTLGRPRPCNHSPIRVQTCPMKYQTMMQTICKDMSACMRQVPAMTIKQAEQCALAFHVFDIKRRNRSAYAAGND